MTVEVLTAEFVGEDGSLDYNHGQTYKLLVERDHPNPEWPVVIRRLDQTGFCPYSSEDAFERNWKVEAGH